MTKSLLTFIITILVTINTLGQDLIIRQNLDKIYCKITNEDTAKVYFVVTKNNNELKTYIDKNDVKEIIYNAANNKNDNITTNTPKSPDGAIIITKTALGYTYTYNNKLLRLNQVADILKTNNAAHTEFNKARVKGSIANVFGCIGGAFLGWQLGSLMSGGNADIVGTGIGIGALLIAIPVVISAEKTGKNAVDIYNQSFTKTSQAKPVIKFGIAPNGLGVSMVF